MSRRHTRFAIRRPTSPLASGRLVPAALACSLFALTAGLAAQAAYPIFTPDDFARTMKTVGQNFGAISPALATGDFESAKARAIRAREQLATTITFWRNSKRDDAVRTLRAATATLDELDTVLSKETVDKDAASALVKQASGACGACHAQYREQDPATKAYRLKPGSVP